MATSDMRNGLVQLGLRGMVLVSVLSAQLAIAQAKQGDDQQQRIQMLIQALASPNRAPKPGDGETRIPSTYGRVTQQKVLDAWSALLKEGTGAFPVLIANTKDNRYSCTLRGPNGDVNCTVGSVCRDIVRNQVEVYWDVIDYPYPGAAPHCFLPVDLSTWWEKNRNRTLRDLQIEATEYALTALKNPSEHEHELRRRGSVKERQLKNIRKLEAFLDQLKATDRAVLPETIEGECRMIGLPGKDPRSSGAHPYEHENEQAKKP